MDSPDVFVDKVLSWGYEGIEIFLPSLTDAFSELFIEKMKGIMHRNADFIFIAQHIVSAEKATVDNYLSKIKINLTELSLFKPSFVAKSNVIFALFKRISSIINKIIYA